MHRVDADHGLELLLLGGDEISLDEIHPRADGAGEGVCILDPGGYGQGAALVGGVENLFPIAGAAFIGRQSGDVLVAGEQQTEWKLTETKLAQLGIVDVP